MLLYGASWWASEEVKEALPAIQQPVWVTMKEQKTELYRCLQRLYYGHAPALDRYDTIMTWCHQVVDSVFLKLAYLDFPGP